MPAVGHLLVSATERCPSGRRGRPAKALYGLKPVSRVRIPLSPPNSVVRPGVTMKALLGTLAIPLAFAGIEALAQVPEKKPMPTQTYVKRTYVKLNPAS